MEREVLSVTDVMERLNITKTAAYALIKAWNEEFSAAGIPVQKGKIDSFLFAYRVHAAERMDKLDRYKRLDFIDVNATSDGKPVEGTERALTCLYNSSVVTPARVRNIIKNGQGEYDKRVIIVTKEKADVFLNGEDDTTE